MVNGITDDPTKIRCYFPRGEIIVVTQNILSVKIPNSYYGYNMEVVRMVYEFS